MEKILAVASGGVIGSILRYLIAIFVQKYHISNFPIATITANMAGCLLIGLFWSYFDKFNISNEFRLFLFTGLLGAFTTFSTYAREIVQFIKLGEYGHAISYMIITNFLGLSLVIIGYIAAQKFTS